MNTKKLEVKIKARRVVYFLLIIINIILLNSCKEKIVNPEPKPEPIPDSIPNPVLNGNYSLCYTKSYNDHWEIFITHLNGTDPQNISNHSYDDEYPQWSPDGKHIVYYSSGYELIVYDVQTKTETKITPDESGPSQNPFWIPNGKICFNYPYAWSKLRGTWIINPDGSNAQNILDTIATNKIYFYQDSFTFIYIDGSQKVHKTDINHTFDDVVLDLGDDENYIPIYGFNPNTQDLLINTHYLNGTEAIGLYNIETKNVFTLCVAEPNYSLNKLRFSNDFSKVAFIEQSSMTGYNLSLIENGIKKRLVEIPKTYPDVSFGWDPIQFSPDDKYIAFTKKYWQSSGWVSFRDYIFVVELSTKRTTIVDKGYNPSWNPIP